MMTRRDVFQQGLLVGREEKQNCKTFCEKNIKKEKVSFTTTQSTR